MKNLLLLILAIFALGTGNARAEDYLIGPGDYLGGLIIDDNDTLLMTGGKIDGLSLSDYAIATIENTDLPIGITSITAGGNGIVNIYGGGIGDIEAINFGTVNINGGSVNNLEMHYQSVSHLYGGTIDTLASDQLLDVEPWWPDAWIHIYCLDGYQYDDNTNLLTGQWGDGMDFNISLLDIGTFPTYDLIEFHIIPEPATLLLFGIGSIFLAKRRKI